MGFAQHWMKLIMECMCSVSYAIVINGKTQKWFKPTRGVRQGDPLSPYLIILLSNVLSRLFLWNVRNGAIKGYKIKRSSPTLTHIQFADDTILFGRAYVREAQAVKKILQ